MKAMDLPTEYSDEYEAPYYESSEVFDDEDAVCATDPSDPNHDIGENDIGENREILDAPREDPVPPKIDATRAADRPQESDRLQGTNDRRSGGDSTERYLDNRVGRLREAIKEILDTAHELHREFDRKLSETAQKTLDRFVEDANAFAGHLSQQVDELRHGGTGASAVLATQSLQCGATDLQDEVEQARPGEGQSRWFRRLFKWLKKVASYLWELIAGLARPKEWSIKGKVEVPVFAKAEMEIKFGPDSPPARILTSATPTDR